jgi:hypothetical protein
VIEELVVDTKTTERSLVERVPLNELSTVKFNVCFNIGDTGLGLIEFTGVVVVATLTYSPELVWPLIVIVIYNVMPLLELGNALVTHTICEVEVDMTEHAVPSEKTTLSELPSVREVGKFEPEIVS